MPSGLDAAGSKSSTSKRKRAAPKESTSRKQLKHSVPDSQSISHPSSMPLARSTADKRSSARESSLSPSKARSKAGLGQKDRARARLVDTAESRELSDMSEFDHLQDLMGGGSSSAHMLETMFGGVPERIKKSIEGLSSNDAHHVMKSLESLNEFVMMSSDDIAFRLRVDQLVPTLMRHLAHQKRMGPGDVPDQRMLLSAQILSVLLDSSPIAAAVLAKSSESLRSLCRIVEELPLVELSDQCIVLLSRMSKEHPLPLINSGALRAVLTPLEFLCMSSQRQCMQIVDDLLSVDRVRVDASLVRDHVDSVIPRLGELLSHPDAGIMKSVSECWRRAVSLWTAFPGGSSQKSLVAPVLKFLLTHDEVNSALIDGLASIASESDPTASQILSSTDVMNKLDKMIKSGSASAALAALHLIAAICPGLALSSTGQVVADERIGLDTAPIVPLIEVILDTAQLSSSHMSHVIQIVLSLTLSGLKLESDPLSKLLPLLEYNLTAYGITRADAATSLACLSLVESLAAHNQLLERFGVLKAVQQLAGDKKRAPRKRVVAEWPTLIESQARRCLPKRSVKSVSSVTFAEKFGSLKDFLCTVNATPFELSTNVDALHALLSDSCLDEHTFTSEVVTVIREHVSETTRLVGLLKSVAENQVALASLSERNRFLEELCLERPMRLTLTNGTSEVLVMTDPLTSVGALTQFIERREAAGISVTQQPLLSEEVDGSEDSFGEDFDDSFEDAFDDLGDAPYDGIEDIDLTQPSQDESDEPEIATVSGKRIAMKINGKTIDPAWTVLQAVAQSVDVNATHGGVYEASPVLGAPLCLVQPPVVRPESAELVAKLFGPIVIHYESLESERTAQVSTPTRLGGSCVHDAVWLQSSFQSALAHEPSVVWTKPIAVLSALEIVLSSFGVEPVKSQRLSALVAREYSSLTVLATGQTSQWLRTFERFGVSLITTDAKRVMVQKFLGIHRASGGRVPIARQKIRIKRDNMLSAALVLMNRFAGLTTQPILEIEYLGEEGSGSGPTNEFYASVVEQLRSTEGLFREGDSLFPAVAKLDESSFALFEKQTAEMKISTSSIVEAAKLSVLDGWWLLGLLAGRAILDSRLVDLDLHPLLWELVKAVLADGRITASERMLARVEPALVTSLRALEEMAESELVALEIDATRLPGGYNYVVSSCEGILTKSRLPEFKENVIKAHLIGGIQYQVLAFAKGFAEVVSPAILDVVAPEEMGTLIRGSSVTNDALWSVETLSAAVHAAHGYTSQSQQVKDLIDILSALSATDRTLFVKFITGARSLPTNGFVGLKPQLTIVKAVNEGRAADESLPTVMTCANFVKLPEYSSANVMRSQLLKAMHEGQGSFLLS